MSGLTGWMSWRQVQPAALMKILVMLLSALVVYRAWTMAFTIDEAYSYQNFSSQSTRVILHTFHSNHHMLFTMLSKASWKLFGVSELTLRLPAVLGGVAFLLLWATLARALSGGGWMQFPVFCLVALNPLVFDLLAAGRGYSLAMALWTAAALLAVQRVGDGGWRPAAGVGLCLGLSVAANLTFAIPAVALAAAWVAASSGFAAVARRASGLGATFLATTWLLLGRSLQRAQAGDFYLGSASWGDFFESMIAASLPGWEHRAVHVASARTAQALGWLALGGSLVYCLLRVRRRQDGGWVICAAMALAVALVEAVHSGMGLPYPYTRTGIYLWLLTAVAGMAALRPGGRWTLGTWAAVAALLTAAEVWALRVDYLGEWVTDADNRGVAACLRQAVGKTDRVCVSGDLEPALSYYRERQRWPVPEVARLGGADCTVMVLLPGDRGRADGGTVLYRGPRSGAVVVRREPAANQ